MNLCNRNVFLKDEFSIIIFQRLSYAIVVNINDGIKSCKLPTSIFYVEDKKICQHEGRKKDILFDTLCWRKVSRKRVQDQNNG